jgi:hypothetical protein
MHTFQGEVVIQQVCVRLQSAGVTFDAADDKIMFKMQHLRCSVHKYDLHATYGLSLQQLQVLQVHSGLGIPILSAGPAADDTCTPLTTNPPTPLTLSSFTTSSLRISTFINRMEANAPQNNALTVTIVACSPTHPEFYTTYAAIKHSITASLATMQVTLQRGPLIELYRMLDASFTYLSGMAQKDFASNANPSGQSNKEAKYVSVPRPTFTPDLADIVLMLDTNKFTLLLGVDDATSLLKLELAGMHLDFVAEDSGLSVAATLQMAQLLDRTQDRGLYETVLCLSNEQLTQLQVTIPRDSTLPIDVAWTAGLYHP